MYENAPIMQELNASEMTPNLKASSENISTLENKRMKKKQQCFANWKLGEGGDINQPSTRIVFYKVLINDEIAS